MTHFKLFDPHANGSRYRLWKRLHVEWLAQVDDQHSAPALSVSISSCGVIRAVRN